MNPGRKIKPPRSRRQVGSASNISLQTNQSFSQPQTQSGFGESESFQFQVPQTPSPNPRTESNFAFENPQQSNPFVQAQQAPINNQASTWRTQSQYRTEPEDEVPDDNPFVQDSYTNQPEEPNPFAGISHGYRPPGQFFLRKMKHNVDPSEFIPDDNPLVSPDYSPQPESQEPNSFAEISWKNSESQRAFQTADEAFEAGTRVTTTVATIAPSSPTNGLPEAESVMPAHFLDQSVTPPMGLAMAAATVTIPGAPKITVGLSLAELQGAATVEACFNAETGTLELVVRRVAGEL